MSYYTREQLEWIHSGKSEASPAAAESSGIGGQAWAAVANLLPNMAESTGRSIFGLLTMGGENPELEHLQHDFTVPDWVETPTPQTTVEKIAKFVGQGLLPEVASYILPYGAAKAVGTAAKVAPLALEMGSQALAGGFTGSKIGEGSMVQGALGGAAFGRLEGLNRLTRLAPSAVLGATDFAVSKMRGIDTQTAMIQAGGQTVGSWLPGRVRVPDVVPAAAAVSPDPFLIPTVAKEAGELFDPSLHPFGPSRGLEQLDETGFAISQNQLQLPLDAPPGRIASDSANVIERSLFEEDALRQSTAGAAALRSDLALQSAKSELEMMRPDEASAEFLLSRKKLLEEQADEVITGPALRDPITKETIVEGKIGDTHASLKSEAIRKGDTAAADAEHVFVTNKGKKLTRKQASARLGLERELQSEDLPLISEVKLSPEPEPITISQKATVPNAPTGSISPIGSLFRSHNEARRSSIARLEDEGLFYSPNKESAQAYHGEGNELQSNVLNPEAKGYSTSENKHVLARRLGIVTKKQESSTKLTGQEYHDWLDRKLSKFFRSNGYDYYSLNNTAEIVVLTKNAVKSPLAEPVVPVPKVHVRTKKVPAKTETPAVLEGSIKSKGAKLKVRKGEDFESNEQHIIEYPDGRQVAIYKDPESKIFYEERGGNEPLGYTYREAVDKLRTREEITKVSKSVEPEQIAISQKPLDEPPESVSLAPAPVEFKVGGKVMYKGQEVEIKSLPSDTSVKVIVAGRKTPLHLSRKAVEPVPSKEIAKSKKVDENEITELLNERSTMQDAIRTATKNGDIESVTEFGARGAEIDSTLSSLPFSTLSRTLRESLKKSGIAVPNVPMKKPKGKKSEAAFVVGNQLVQAVGGGVAGAATGGAITDWDPMAMVGFGMAGMFGGVAISKVVGDMLKNTIRADMPPAKTTAEYAAREAALAGEAIGKGSRQLAGEASLGRGGLAGKLFRGFEKMSSLHGFDKLRNVFIRAGGEAESLGRAINTIFKQMIATGAKITPEFNLKWSRYLEGRMDPLTIEAELSRSTFVTDEALKGMDHARKTAAKNQYDETWAVYDAQGMKKIVHIDSGAKARLIRMQEKEFRASLNSDELVLADYSIAARKVLNDAIDLNAMGMTKAEADEFLQSKYQYLPRTYKFFEESNFRPSEANIQARVDELLSALPPASRADPDMAAQLRTTVLSWIEDLRTRQANQKATGSKNKDLDVSLSIQRENLSTAQRAILGENIGLEQVGEAVARLIPTAHSSKAIYDFANLELPNGLRAVYDSEGWRKARHDVRMDIEKDAVTRALGVGVRDKLNDHLWKKMDELIAYKKVSSEASFGKLNDMYGSRHVMDQLQDFSSPWQMFEGQVGRSFNWINNFTKQAHTVYSLVTQIRNFISNGVFLAIGRADIKSMKLAYQIMRHPDKFKAEIDLLYKTQIWGVNQVDAEFKGTAKAWMEGITSSQNIGSKAWKRFEKFAQTSYATPDTFTRTATFLAARERFARDLGFHKNDPRVIDEAMTYTNRRTMDYKNIAPAIKIARQAPFFNLFVSYQWEMGRITKNLVEDAFGFGPQTKGKPDVHAQIMLGGLAGLVPAIYATATSQLSPKDKADWDKMNAQSRTYEKYQTRLPLSRRADGSFRVLNVSPLVNNDNIAQTVKALASGNFKDVLAVNPIFGWQNTPVFNIMSESISGINLRTGKEIHTLNDKIGTVVEKLLPSWAPPYGSEYKKIATPDYGGVRGQPNVRTGNIEGMDTLLTRYLTGMNLLTANPNLVNAAFWKEAKREIANEKAYLNYLGMNGVSPERMKIEAAKTGEAIKQIIFEATNKSEIKQHDQLKQK